MQDSKEWKHKHKGDLSRKHPRGSSEKTPSSQIAEMVKKRSTERSQERDARNDTRYSSASPVFSHERITHVSGDCSLAVYNYLASSSRTLEGYIVQEM